MVASKCESVHTEFPDALRVAVYGFLLAYCFMGVSIVSDMFMGAIEVITSHRRQRLLPTGQLITMKVWNDTVANLTLMALGSSAPEILLAVTELLGGQMYAGELGSATIVGSASFNLLMIVALCIFVIPSTEIRKIEEMPVFYITTGFMFLAYFWLWLVVSVITPDIVEIWEAVITLVCLPLLVVISYLADVGFFGEFGKAMEVRAEDVATVCEILGDFERNTVEAIRAGLSERPHLLELLNAPSAADMVELRTMVKRHSINRKSRAVHRIEATRLLTGGRKIQWEKRKGEDNNIRAFGLSRAAIQGVPLALPKGSGDPHVQFPTESQCLHHSMLSKQVLVCRSGDCSTSIRVMFGVVKVVKSGTRRVSLFSRMPSSASLGSGQFGSSASLGDRQRSQFGSNASLGESSRDRQRSPMGSAETMAAVQSTTSTEDESHSQGATSVSMRAAFANNKQRSQRLSQACQTGMVMFEAGQRFAYITAHVPSGVGLEDGDSNQFAVNLFQVENGEGEATDVELGTIKKTLVVLRRGDVCGRVRFPYSQLLVEGPPVKQIIEVMVRRTNNCDNHSTCSFRTEALSAVPGYDFTHIEGTLEWEPGITEAIVEIEILPKRVSKPQDSFLLILEEPEHCDFDSTTDGGVESEILTIEVGPRDLLETSGVSQKLLKWLDQGINFDQWRLGNQEYKEQIVGAIFCNGSLEEQRAASCFDLAFHFLALPWKVIFISVPPPTYCAGWITFWMSLMAIAGMTYMIGDLAELFGCVIGMPDLVTAISIVALGTSMPDLFASKTAAIQDPTADAAIVNVTGSNSVNVFLGLGLPWTMAAVYWHVLPWDSDWESRYPEVANAQRESGVMKFVVRSGDLGFSVTVFFAAAFLAISILTLRRKRIGAELGGPFQFKLASSCALAILWITYVALSGWWCVRQEFASDNEKLAALVVGFSMMGAPWLVVMIMGFRMPPIRLNPSLVRCETGEMREQQSYRKENSSNAFTTEAFAIGSSDALKVQDIVPTTADGDDEESNTARDIGTAPIETVRRSRSFHHDLQSK